MSPPKLIVISPARRLIVTRSSASVPKTGQGLVRIHHLVRRRRPLGADGINMGTRFIATKEAPAHDNVKQAPIAANELQTRLIMCPLRSTERVLTNASVEEILAVERDTRSLADFAKSGVCKKKQRLTMSNLHKGHYGKSNIYMGECLTFRAEVCLPNRSMMAAAIQLSVFVSPRKADGRSDRRCRRSHLHR